MTWKKRDEASANKLLKAVTALPITIERATNSRIMQAAHLKAQYPVSYADAFAIGLTIELKATVLTDDPEFKNLVNVISIQFLQP